MAGTVAHGTLQLHRPCPGRTASLPRPAAPCALHLRCQPAHPQHTGISCASLALSAWQHRHGLALTEYNRRLSLTGFALAGGFQCATPSTRCSHVAAAAAVEGALAFTLLALALLQADSQSPIRCFRPWHPLV